MSPPQPDLAAADLVDRLLAREVSALSDADNCRSSIAAAGA